jgi:hypothetical protein
VGVNAVAYIEHALRQDELERLDIIFNDTLPDDLGPWTFEILPTTEWLAEGSALLNGNDLTVFFGVRTACISSLIRWRGFLADDKLRMEFRAQVLPVAGALRARSIVWAPDGQLHPCEEAFVAPGGSAEGLVTCLVSSDFRRLSSLLEIGSKLKQEAEAGQVHIFVEELIRSSEEETATE